MITICPHCGEEIEVETGTNFTPIDVTYQPVYDGEGLIVPPIVP